MENIPDAPWIRYAERTGLPTWAQYYEDDEEMEDDDADEEWDEVLHRSDSEDFLL